MVRPPRAQIANGWWLLDKPFAAVDTRSVMVEAMRSGHVGVDFVVRVLRHKRIVKAFRDARITVCN